MRWPQRLVIIACWLGFVFVVGRFSHHAHVQRQPHAASYEDWRGILVALLDSHNFEGMPLTEAREAPPVTQRPVVVQATSASFCLGGVTFCEGPRDVAITSTEVEGIPLDLRHELVAANKAVVCNVPVPQSPFFVYGSNEMKHGHLDGTWTYFYSQFPNTAGIMQTSRPAVSADERYAVIYAESYCESACGNGALYFLERAPAGWKIVRWSSMWNDKSPDKARRW